MKHKRWMLWAGRLLLFGGAITPAVTLSIEWLVSALANVKAYLLLADMLSYSGPLLAIFVIAWKRPIGGSIGAILWGIFGFFAALSEGGHYKIAFPPPAYGVFTLGGILNLAYALISKKTKRNTSEGKGAQKPVKP